jgi:type VI secretion system protein VasJ
MELLTLGKTPISETTPSGKDISYDPCFDQLSEEIKKLSSPTATNGVDWRKIIDISQNILSQQSKNLLVTCYLSIALLKTEKFHGFAKGVHVLKDSLENFWDTMFPPIKRMRGRKNALQWWKEKVEESIPLLEAETWERKQRESFINDLKYIDDFFGENMDDAPILRTMIDSIASIVHEEGAGSVVTPEIPAPIAGKEARQVSPTPSPAAIPSPSGAIQETDTEKLINSGMDYLKHAATILFQKNPFDAVAHHLNRIVAWLPIDSLPSATDGVTLLPPPDGQIISSLTGLYQSGNWKDLLESAESKVRQFLFWIDLSRYVSEALDHLGHTLISEMVGNETYYYVKRFPGIEKLSFSDGTPFANEETRRWLEEYDSKKSGEIANVTLSTGDSSQQLINKELVTAQKMIKENKLAEALVALRENSARATSVREQLLWKLGLCQLLSRAQKAELAIPYIENILSVLDEYKIEKWEPSLAIEAITTALSTLRVQKGKQNDTLRETLVKRMSILNPAKALEFI